MVTKSEQSKEDDSKFQFRLREILVSNFRLLASPEVNPDAGLASIEFGFNFTFQPDLDITVCKIHFKYLLATDLKDVSNGTTNVLTADINYIFQVLNLAKYLSEKDGKQVLDNGLLLNLVNVSYSTSRGIIYERTRGYGISNLVLPVLNVDEYIQDITFNK